MAPKVLNLRGKSEIAVYRAHGHKSTSPQALTKRISVGTGANLVTTAAMFQSLAIALITELNEKRVLILPGVGTFSVKRSPARDGCMMKVG
eukprot:6050436-Pyramimonas_sp.AAC.1